MKLLAILLVLRGGVFPQAQSRVPPPRETAWRGYLAAGTGSTVAIGPTVTDSALAFLAPQWSLPVSRSVEYVIEGHFSRYFSPGGYFVGIVPVGARVFTLGAGRRYYFAAGAGLGWSDLEWLPEIDRRFNFLLEGGVGVHWKPAGGAGRFLEVRLVHLSNGGTAGRNLGLNGLALVGGWRVR